MESNVATRFEVRRDLRDFTVIEGVVVDGAASGAVSSTQKAAWPKPPFAGKIDWRVSSVKVADNLGYALVAQLDRAQLS